MIMLIARLLAESPEFEHYTKEDKQTVTACTFYGRQYTPEDKPVIRFRRCVNEHNNKEARLRADNGRLRQYRVHELADNKI